VCNAFTGGRQRSLQRVTEEKESRGLFAVLPAPRARCRVAGRAAENRAGKFQGEMAGKGQQGRVWSSVVRYRQESPVRAILAAVGQGPCGFACTRQRSSRVDSRILRGVTYLPGFSAGVNRRRCECFGHVARSLDPPCRGCDQRQPGLMVKPARAFLGFALVRQGTGGPACVFSRGTGRFD